MNVLQWVGQSTVASTKETNSHEIMVYSPLLFPTADGGVTADVARVKKEGVDAQGKKVNTDMLKSNKVVPATWKPIGEPNRLTPPDLREGSQVNLYQFSGSSEYFWTTFGFAAETMRCETIVYGWNAMPTDNEDSKYDLSKYYTMIVDTRTGQMSLRNSNANGEKSIIEAKFNFMEGHFMMSGAQNSLLIWDDLNHSFTYHNAEESVLTVDKDKMYAFTKGGIMLQTDDDISMQCKSFLLQAKDVTMNVEDQTTINCPETQHNGNLTVDGTIHSTGDMKSDSTVTGMSGVKTGAGIDVDKHKHPNGNNGNDTGPAKM
jgi:hypothetical protein